MMGIMQAHKIVVHYCGDGGQACSSEKAEAMLGDNQNILKLFKLIQHEQSNRDHYCSNKGLSIEIVPMTRGTI